MLVFSIVLAEKAAANREHFKNCFTVPSFLVFFTISDFSLYFIDYALRKEVRWDQRCLGLEAMLRHNLLGFTIQPVPHPGKVFFASAFFSRQKLVNADYFGTFLKILLCSICC